MSSDSVKSHPYHIVNPSVWPLFGIGGIWYMHGGPLYAFLAGFVVVLVVMYNWWKDVVVEANGGIDHTAEVQHGLRMGMLLFIVSEVMFFFAFFWAYFANTVPAISRVAHAVWPPEGIVPLPAWDIPFLNTLILLSSGVTVTYAHHALRLGDHKRCASGLLLTILLGATFTGFQAYEYIHASFKFTDGIYSSTFYLATGFHGFHVLVGTIFLIVCYFRTLKGHFTAEQHVGFEAAAWYWHFVDVVWLFLFCSIYWWGS